MKLEVNLFAGLREAAGCSRLTIELAEPSTAGNVVDEVLKQIPQGHDWMKVCRLAVDDAYVDPDHIVKSGSRCDLIPPVSGG